MRKILALLVLVSFAGSSFLSAAAVVSENILLDEADLVVVQQGASGGFVPGALVEAQRGNQWIADLIIIHASASWSFALIIEISPVESVKTGDLLHLKRNFNHL